MTFLGLALWVVQYGLQWHAVANRDDPGDLVPPRDWKYFPQVWYEYGMKSWYANRPEAAGDNFRKALSIHVLHVDAWIGLAQAEAAGGRHGVAEAMLQFTCDLTPEVVRWKWPQLLLARDLGREDIFLANINAVVAHHALREDALQLLDRHLGRDTVRVLEVLAAHNLPDYLRWLMKWKRTEDSFQVWTALVREGSIDNALYERYVGFLIGQNEFRRASAIRAVFSRHAGLSNPGFEAPLDGDPFGWRVHSGGAWEIRRVRSGRQGDHALQVTFSGEENVHAGLLGQIIPVPPGSSGTLSFWWRSVKLTTDRRPFVEIRSLEGPSRRWQSDMAPSDTDWRQVTIAFDVPETCHALRVELRRHQSHRFDNKIKGELWLDDFRLETGPLPNESTRHGGPMEPES